MGKHSKAHICVNKTGTDETSKYEGRNLGTVYASEVVDCQYYTHTAQEERDIQARRRFY